MNKTVCQLLYTTSIQLTLDKFKANICKMKKNSKLLKLIGFIILAVSCILFILIPVVPWLGFSAGQIAGISAGLLIAGEILFYSSLIILGRSFFDKIKHKLKFWKSKTKGPGLSAESEK